MIEVSEILQTIRMVSEQHFDIRTITMGISLLDCKKNTDRETAQAVYDKVTRVARDLVRVGGELESELGVPIVNKRISVTPVGMICGDDPVAIAVALDEAAGTVGVNFIGGYGALMHKGATRAEETLLDSMPEAFSKTARLCGSVNVGSTRSGINMDAVRKMGHVIKRTAELTADTDGFGCAKIVVFANAVEDNPFMAGAFHGVGEPECVVNVGVSGPGVVQRALREVRGEPFDVVAETIKRTAFKITRVGELVAQEAAKRLGMAQPTLANKLRLLTLTPVQQEFCVAQNLTERHARAVLRLPTEELRSKALKTAAQRGYTLQQTEALVERVLSARPKPKRKLMVKDVRIFVNTIEHALKVMTGSGIPATATRNENEEYIEYVVRIPTRPAARPAAQEKQPQATNAGPKEGKTPPSSACGQGKAAAPGGKLEPAPGARQAQGPQQIQRAEEREGISLPEPGETALAPQAQKNPRP